MEGGGGEGRPRPGLLEPENTIRRKCLSVWNNVKYGKKAWTAAEMFNQELRCTVTKS